MKVTAGRLKGLLLKGPKHIRPVTSFIKEAIFNILQVVDWHNTKVLDLFAGAGNFGIEAISRGANYVVFVDIAKETKHYVLSNLTKVDWNGTVIIGDFRDIVKKFFKKNEKFNIIFADPPFDKDLGMEVVSLIERYDILTENGMLILRVRDKEKVEFSEKWLVESRFYGDSSVYFVKRRLECEF